MPKPPNVAPVYPLREEKTKTIIPTGGSGPLVIFNPELQDPASLMHLHANKNFYKVIDALKKENVDTVILAHEKSVDLIKRYLNRMGDFANKVTVIKTENPFNVELD